MTWVTLTGSDGAKKAFNSPSELAARLGNRSPTSAGADGMNYSSSASQHSRRAPSAIVSAEDAQVFEEMATSTNVVMSAHKNLGRKARSVAAQSQSSHNSAAVHSVAGRVIKDAISKADTVLAYSNNVQHSNTMKSSDYKSMSTGISTISDSATHTAYTTTEGGTNTRTSESGTYESQESSQLVAPSQIVVPTPKLRQASQTNNLQLNIPPSSSAPGSANTPVTANNRRQPSPRRGQDLDLKNNDNSFSVIGGLIVDFFQSKLKPGQTSVNLTIEDINKLERLAPPRVRANFIEAVRYRIATIPPGSDKPVHVLTRKCQKFGFNQESPRNPLLLQAPSQTSPQIPKVPPAASTLSDAKRSVSTKSTLPISQSVSNSCQSSRVDPPSVASKFSRRSQASTNAKMGPPDPSEVGTAQYDTVKTGPGSQHTSQTNSTASVSTTYSASTMTNAQTIKSGPNNLSETNGLVSAPVHQQISEEKDFPGGSVADSRATSDSYLQTITKATAKAASNKAPDPPLYLGNRPDPSIVAMNDDSGRISVVEQTPPAEPPSSDMKVTQEPPENKEQSKVQSTEQQNPTNAHSVNSSQQQNAASSQQRNAASTQQQNTTNSQQQKSVKPMEQPNSAWNKSEEKEDFPRASNGHLFLSKSTTNTVAPSDFRSTEGLARQQLMAELQEATNLMAESKTAEAAQFWREHVVELQARLRALQSSGDGGSVLTTSTFLEMGTTAGTATTTTTSTGQNYNVGGSIATDKLLSTIVNDHHLVKSVASEVALKDQTRDRKDDSDNVACPNHKILSPFHKAEEYRPPLLESHKVNAPVTVGTKSTGTQSMEERGTVGEVETESNVNPDSEQMPMVDVVAPADLPGGYHFEAEIEGRRFLATVPLGGVRKGETFSCHMRDLEKVGSDIPVGRWRDGIFNCCAYGPSPVIFNSLFCPLVMLSQIFTRVNFDFLGRRNTHRGARAKTLFTIMQFWLLLNVALFVGYYFKWSGQYQITNADFGAFAFVNIVYLIFVVYVTASARGNLREKYFIRETFCYDLEDCCCATFCLPCTLCQMARHTVDYDDYEAVCCNQTGLPECYQVETVATTPKSGNNKYYV